MMYTISMDTSTFFFKKEIVSNRKKTYFADMDSKIIKHISIFTDQGVDSPVRVEEGKIRMFVKRKGSGRFYPVVYTGKKYLISKTKKGVIDIFRVKG